MQRRHSYEKGAYERKIWENLGTESDSELGPEIDKIGDDSPEVPGDKVTIETEFQPLTTTAGRDDLTPALRTLVTLTSTLNNLHCTIRECHLETAARYQEAEVEYRRGTGTTNQATVSKYKLADKEAEATQAIAAQQATTQEFGDTKRANEGREEELRKIEEEELRKIVPMEEEAPAQGSDRRWTVGKGKASPPQGSQPPSTGRASTQQAQTLVLHVAVRRHKPARLCR